MYYGECENGQLIAVFITGLVILLLSCYYYNNIEGKITEY